MELPLDFCRLMRQQYGEEMAERLFVGLSVDSSVSVRLNTRKWRQVARAVVAEEDDRSEGSQTAPNATAPSLRQEQERQLSCSVPWCPAAFYLAERPPFTFDPLFHAGAYYVQEASSMFLWHVLDKVCPELATTPNAVALDLCAAPGGKSTLIRSFLDEKAWLVSNEPIAKRAHILSENMTKWGAPNTLVSQNFPPDFRRQEHAFDLIVCDVPCSGEGMFRKDEQAIKEWSLQNVDACWQRQRDIVEDIWPCLRPGGTLVYSTCTFNHLEDEDNVEWIERTLGAELLPIDYDPAWGIVETRSGMMHFLPGVARGEGFFIAALRKQGDTLPRRTLAECDSCVKRLSKALRLMSAPETQKVMALDGDKTLPRHELTYDEALAYLRHEVLRFPPEAEVPRGQVVVCYRGLPLGLVKNIGSRANNLYPDEWRIRTTYTTPFTLLS